MNQPKFGATGKIKKADDEIAAHQISETLKSIETDLQAGRLDAETVTHPFHKITLADADKLEKIEDHFKGLSGIPMPDHRLHDLSTESVAGLLLARLKAQGYIVYFDEKVIAETLEKARARLGSLLD